MSLKPPHPPRATLTPPPAYPAGMSSPPLSPSSSLAPPSDDASDLSDDWTEVESESVNPSLLGDISSDSGSEHGARASGFDADESDVDDDRGVPLHSPSLRGSYTDAEFTDVSLSKSSLATLHDDLAPLSSIELVFPDPGASFATSSGTISGGITPHGSTAALIPNTDHASRPRASTELDKAARYSPRRGSSPVRRGVNESWLRSSNLWAPPQDLHHNQHVDYQILSSTESLDIPQVIPSHIDSSNDLQLFQATNPLPVANDIDVLEPEHADDADVKEMEAVVLDSSEKRVAEVASRREQTLRQIRQALSAAAIVSMRRGAKKWLPVLAMASVLSLAFFGPYKTPLTSVLTRQREIIWSNAQSSEVPQITSVFSSGQSTNTVQSASLLPAASPVSTVKMIPDLHLIRQALSTLSTVHNKVKSAPEVSTSSSVLQSSSHVPSQPKREGRLSTSCVSVAIREGNVALTVSTSDLVLDDSATRTPSWRTKVFGASSPTVPAPTNDSSPAEAFGQNCASGVSVSEHPDVLAQLHCAFGSIRNYTSVASRYIGHAFGPLVCAVESDLNDVFGLARKALSSAADRSRIIVNRASRGAVITHTLVKSTVQHMRDNTMRFFSTHHPPKPDEAFVHAKAMFETLSEYVEDQLDHLSDMVEEQAEAMHDKGLYTIKKAKKGLNNLIRDAKAMSGGGQVAVDGQEKKIRLDVTRDGPLPFVQSGQGKRRERMGRQRRPRAAKREGRRERQQQRTPAPIPPPEPPSKARQLLDIVHHGAVALVL